MAVTIDQARISTYESTVRHLAQQSVNKLRQFVRTDMDGGEDHSWDRVGSVDMSLKSGVRQATPEVDNPWTRRVSQPAVYDVGATSELSDPSQMLIDPNSTIAKSHGMAAKRKFDDIIIAAATADALNGDATTTAFDYTNNSVGSYTTEISFDDVTALQESYMESDIDPDVPKVLVVGPKQIRKLMNVTQQTSQDYVKRSLEQLSSTGIVPNWMGFTWIMSTRLQTGGDTGGGAGTIDCISFTQQGIGLEVNDEASAKVAEDPSISFAWRIYCWLQAGAVRVEDEHVKVLKAINA